MSLDRGVEGPLCARWAFSPAKSLRAAARTKTARSPGRRVPAGPAWRSSRAKMADRAASDCPALAIGGNQRALAAILVSSRRRFGVIGRYACMAHSSGRSPQSELQVVPLSQIKLP